MTTGRLQPGDARGGDSGAVAGVELGAGVVEVIPNERGHGLTAPPVVSNEVDGEGGNPGG